jgi:dTDP-4-dehydrorhamnose reductase
MTVAILGADGMLGTDVTACLRQAGHDCRLACQPAFDITHAAQLAELTAGADTIVNCAAYTNVDGAERQRELAFAVNAEAVGRLGELAARRRQYVVHISTDFVYDGLKATPYTEADAPRPISVYGESKWRGEQLLAASGCAHAIVRIEWTYGRHGRHFITKLLERASQQREVAVVADQTGSPTPTTAVADVLRQVVDNRLEGTYLYAAGGYGSRFEVACWIAARLGLAVSLRPCRTAEFPAPAQRPLNSCFACDRLDRALGLRRQPWQDLLTAYLEQGQ